MPVLLQTPGLHALCCFSDAPLIPLGTHSRDLLSLHLCSVLWVMRIYLLSSVSLDVLPQVLSFTFTLSSNGFVLFFQVVFYFPNLSILRSCVYGRAMSLLTN